MLYPLSLEEILAKNSLLSPEQIKAAATESKKNGHSFQQTLIQLKLLTEEQILLTAAKELNIPYLPRLLPDSLDPSIIKNIPARFVIHYRFIPLEEKDGALSIAVNDLYDIQILDELKLVLGKNISLVLTSGKEIDDAIRKHYGVGAATVERMLVESGIEILTEEKREDENIEDQVAEASVIKFFNQILVQAIKDRATDIHIEPFEDQLRIRYRIDGVLYEADVPSTIKYFQSPLVSRIKVMAGLNIAEKRLPQDGKIKIRMGKEEFDLRCSILPTPFGETLDIRILSRKSILLGMEELGFSKEDLKKFAVLIAQPHGIILVTGPTGSGKTTTLYAALSTLNSGDRKILTIEDPIEYQLRGITQMQVHPKIGFTFANALRSMLRHDPDIILVGEIRDLETAEIAIRTALTGHLVFSTLHTNDATGGITRLLEMGIEPYLVSSSVLGAIAQRLVRLICPHCKKEVELKSDLLKRVGIDENNTEGLTLYQGNGCETCKGTGYLGRTAIFETLIFSDKVRELVLSRTPTHLIKQEALNEGMRTLRQDGWEKVKKGLTTIDEVLRATPEEKIFID